MLRSRLASAGGLAVGTTWQALGPLVVTNSPFGKQNSGRVDTIAVAQTSSSDVSRGEIFAGTAGGGVWSSSNGGKSWVTHTDRAATGLAIGAIAIDPTNSSVIYAGTGEANDCGDCFYGGGVLKSTNGGSTWTVENPGGVFTGADFAAIAIDPRHPLHIFAATTSGFFESVNGGTTWARPTGTGTFNYFATSLALDPTTNPTTVYLASEVVGVQKSTDGGTNFTKLGGLPGAANFGDAALGIGTKTSTNPTADRTLYAAVQLNGKTDPNHGDLSMYKSTNGGGTWARLTIPAYTNQAYAFGRGTSDQAWYDNAIAVDPANPSHVIAGGIAQVETTNGGASWSNINGQNFDANPPANVIHPDTHAFAFTPTPGEVLIGCDGGVYEYTGGGSAHVTNLNSNLNTSQLYPDLGVYDNGAKILAGLQDNGAALYTGSASWLDVTSGDGGYANINPLDPNQMFFESDEDLYRYVSPAPPDDILPIGLPDARTNFVSPVTLVPNPSSKDNPTIYYGAGDLWVTHNPSASAPQWRRLTNVGSGVSAITVAPSNPAVVYVGFDDGKLVVSTNATSSSPTFTYLYPSVDQWITHIDVSRTNPGRISLSFSDSNTQTYSVPPMVDMGAVSLSGTPSAKFTDVTGNLPAGVASNSVLSYGSALIVATDVGVFSTASPNGGSTRWTSVGAGLPNVQVLALTLDPNGDLFAGTHGRGVWKLPTALPVYESGLKITGTAVSGDTLSVATGTWTNKPTSFQYQWYRCNASGSGCGAVVHATASTYHLTATDVSHTLRVVVTGANGYGKSGPVESAQSAVVKAS